MKPISWIPAFSYIALLWSQNVDGQRNISCAGSPCQNGALCEETDTGYQCFCVDGYAGENCETNFDDCQSTPCNNNSTCIDGVANFSCVCRSGFTGINCQVNVDECRSSPCAKNSTCIDMIDGFKCECSPPYRGDNCSILPCDTTPCDNNAVCENDPTFVKSSTGFTCDCVPGFTGLQCEINIEDCDLENDTSCLGNGLCVDGIDGYSCLCQPGWIGDKCQLPEDDCIGHSCRNGGSCNDQHLGYTCTCIEGYAGDLCERERDECTTWQPCQNGATCVDLFNNYRCQCKVGWHGKNCTEEVDECLTNPCQNGAQCVDIVGDFVCQCAPFYTGELCETLFNPCSPDYNECQNDALCVTPPDGKYRCFCSTGFTGTNCEVNINECIESPCHNNATCEDYTAGYTCHCSPGWTDIYCTTNIDDCVSQPCLNGADCFDLLNGFNCNCTAEYTGLICDELMDYCAPNPCYHNSVCIKLVGDYQCQCLPPYTGRNCEDLINACESSPCFQTSTCINTEGGYECLCESPYTGKRCELFKDFCASQPCLNGGSCRQLRDNWVCICPPYLTGRQCTDLVDYCKGNPCLNLGLCINNEFGFRCVCLFGFTGTVCEEQIDFCVQKPCLNSGNCSNIPGGFNCDCNETYTGELCESEVTVSSAVTESGFISEPTISVFTPRQSLQTVMKSIDTMSIITLEVSLSTLDFINSRIADTFMSSFSQIIPKPIKTDQTSSLMMDITKKTSSVYLTSAMITPLLSHKSNTLSSTSLSSIETSVLPSIILSESMPSSQYIVPVFSSNTQITSVFLHDSLGSSFSSTMAIIASDGLSIHLSTFSFTSLSAIEYSFGSTSLTANHFISDIEDLSLTQSLPHLSLGFSATPSYETSSGFSLPIYSLEGMHSSKHHQVSSQSNSNTVKSNNALVTLTDSLLELHTNYSSLESSLKSNMNPFSDLTSVISFSTSEYFHPVYDHLTSSFHESSSNLFISRSFTPMDSTIVIETDSVTPTTANEEMNSFSNTISQTESILITEKSSGIHTHSSFLSVTELQNLSLDDEISLTVFERTPTLHPSYSPTPVLISSSEDFSDSRLTTPMVQFSPALSSTLDYNTSLPVENVSQMHVTDSSAIFRTTLSTPLNLSSNLFEISEDYEPKFTITHISSVTSQSEDYTSIPIITTTPGLPISSFGSTEVSHIMTASLFSAFDNVISTLSSFISISSNPLIFQSTSQTSLSVHNLDDISNTNVDLSSVLETAFEKIQVYTPVSDTSSLSPFSQSDFMKNASSDDLSFFSLSTVTTSTLLLSAIENTNYLRSSAVVFTSINISQFSTSSLASEIGPSFDLIPNSVEVYSGTYIYSISFHYPPVSSFNSHTAFHTVSVSSSFVDVSFDQPKSVSSSSSEPISLSSEFNLFSYHPVSQTESIPSIRTFVSRFSLTDSKNFESANTKNIHASEQTATENTVLVTFQTSNEVSDLSSSSSISNQTFTYNSSTTSLELSGSASSNSKTSQTFTYSSSTTSLELSGSASTNSKTSQTFTYSSSTTSLELSGSASYNSKTSQTFTYSSSTTSLELSEIASSNSETSQTFTFSSSITSLELPEIASSNSKTSQTLTNSSSTTSLDASEILLSSSSDTSLVDLLEDSAESLPSKSSLKSSYRLTFSTPDTSSTDLAIDSTILIASGVSTGLYNTMASSTPHIGISVIDSIMVSPVATSFVMTDHFLQTTSTLTTEPTIVPSTPLPSCGRLVCHNGGICRQDLFGVFCDCPSGFIGPACESENTACSGFTCENGGVCMVVLTTNNQQIPQCQCPVPFFGTLCDQETLVYYPAFHGQSNLVFNSPGLMAMQANEIVLYIKTTQSNGVVLFSNSYQSTESTMRDLSFIQLSLGNGQLQYRFSCDGIITTVIKTDQVVNTGDVFEIVIRQMWPSTIGEWCSASVRVNMKTFVGAPALTVKQPQQLGDVVLGGYLRTRIKKDEIVSRETIAGYIGCIQSLQINGRELDMMKMASSGMNIENCNVPVCQHNPCKNGASCHSTTDNWYCKCPAGYGGDLCETKLCETNPCVHGGSCVVLDDIKDILCVCPYGRGGAFCELELKPEVPFFSGIQFGHTSYIAYSNMYYVRDNFQIEFNLIIDGNFTENNLILYMGHTDTVEGSNVDYFMLGILRGYIYMRFDLGSGPADIYSPGPIDLDIPIHTVKLGRDGRMGWLKLDNQNNVTGQSAELLTSLNIQPYMYVGGVEKHRQNIIPSLSLYQDGLKGCVYDLKIKTFHTEFTEPGIPPGHVEKGRNVRQCASMTCDQNPCQNGAECIDIGASVFCNCTDGWSGIFCGEQISICDVNHTCFYGSTCLPTPFGGYKCLCPLGKKGDKCNQDTTISDAMFLGENSYMTFEPVYVKSVMDIHLQIKPSESTGLLFYVAMRLHSNAGDFLSITMSDWNVELRFSLGSELNVIRNTGKLVKDEWQTIQSGRNSTHCYISVNGSISVDVISGNMLYLDTTTQFFLGGLPDLSTASPLAFADEPSGYEGCIREFVVNGRSYELNTNGATSGCDILDCDNTPCGYMTCKNGGLCHVINNERYNCTCIGSFDGKTCTVPVECVNHTCIHGDCIPESPYKCLCHLGWTGKFCDTDIQIGSSAFLSDESFMVYKTSSNVIPNTNYTNISLSFQSTKLHGLIFWHGQTYTDDEDYIGLGLYEGRVKLVWNLGWYSRTETVTNIRYNDGQWHLVEIHRQGQMTSLMIDGTIYKSQVSGDFHHLDTGQYLYLGSFQEGRIKQKTLDKFHEPFQGCIKDVQIQGTSILFDHGENGRNLQPCTND